MRKLCDRRVFVVLALAVVTACGGQAAPAATSVIPATSTKAPPPPTKVPPSATAPAATPTSTSVPTLQPTTAAGTAENQSEAFDPNNFDQSAQITNEWLPLKPGTRFVYEGKSLNDEGNLVPHRIVVNVTDLTKMIGGVRAAVTWDTDYSEDKLAETELAFYAQDKDGNVWYMGEYPEAYENGKFVEAPTWIHGIADARAGIMMKAKPQTGTPTYAEGWGPAVGWTDVGQVDQTGQKTCVPVDCYEDVLVIAETSHTEPNAQQLKYYAPHVGNVHVGWRGGGEKTKETLDLTKIEQLDPQALAEVRAEALKLEKHAYEVSKDVYAKTSPLE